MATEVDLFNAAVLSTLPAGVLSAYAGTTVPDGWLICNGAAISRTTYARLFKAIGTKWGAGDGSTTFNLPDLSDRFIEGTADASKVGTYLEAGLPNITGRTQVTDYGPMRLFTADGALFPNPNVTRGMVGEAQITGAELALDASRSSNIYGGTATVQPSSLYALIIIKV